MRLLLNFTRLYIWSVLYLLFVNTPDLLGQHHVIPQERENLTTDTAFFKSQALPYQNWLDEIGIGHLLKVHEVTVKPAQYVNLYLRVVDKYGNHPEKQTAFAAQAWEDIRKAFNKRSNILFETQLLLEMGHLMQVELDQAVVHFFDTYHTDITSYVSYHIYLKGEKLIVDKEMEPTRSTIHKFPIILNEMRYENQPITEDYEVIPSKPKMTINDYADRILRFCEEYYDTKETNPNIYNKLILDSKGGVCRIVVAPLEKELIKEAELLICDWLNGLGFNCSTVKQERLKFDFSLTQDENDKWYLNCKLHGEFREPKVLSGNLGTYKNIDYDDDSKQRLFDYGELLMSKLVDYLFQP